MNKKRNNKGFSLVELIVVIAVMAVLVVVLAPAYLRYVDKAKLQKDESAISEVVNAVKIAAAEEKVSNEIPSTGSLVLKFTSGNAFEVHSTSITGDDADAENLISELTATVGTVTLSSSTYKNATVYITISQNTNHVLTVSYSTTAPTA